VCEEITTDAAIAPSSAARIPASIASATDTDEVVKRVQIDNSDDHALDQEADMWQQGRRRYDVPPLSNSCITSQHTDPEVFKV
jgi:hypothetical protein